MKNNLQALRAAFEALRPYVRPEADHLAGAMSVALDQADAAADEYDFGDDDEVELATAAPVKKTTKRGK